MPTPSELDIERGALHFLKLEDLDRWQVIGEKTRECRVLLCPEDVGGFSAHALHLPGVVSQGETQEEALENIREAFRGAVAVYQEDCGKIPWQPVEVDRPEGSVERWILVDV